MWAGIKKYLNSGMTTPLDTLIANAQSALTTILNTINTNLTTVSDKTAYIHGDCSALGSVSGYATSSSTKTVANLSGKGKAVIYKVTTTTTYLQAMCPTIIVDGQTHPIFNGSNTIYSNSLAFSALMDLGIEFNKTLVVKIKVTNEYYTSDCSVRVDYQLFE